jgi:CBS domain-containing protein
MKTIREILRPSFLLKVPAHAPVLHAVRAMSHHNVGIVAVVDAHALVGVFSERDVVRRVVDHGLDPSVTPVSAVMTSQVVFAGMDEDVQVAMRRMDQANIRHLPVLDGHDVVAMLSVRDLLRASMADAETELAHLRAYICDGEVFRV